MRINAQRLRAELEQLSTFGREPSGGVSRPALSNADIRARNWYADLARQADLDTHVDGLFNITARLGGNSVPAVWSGSHLDSVPNGGMFDGALGAMASLECVRRLREEGVPLARPVVAAAFSDEEGAFHGYLGSKGLVRNWSEAELKEMTNHDGLNVIDALRAHGVEAAEAANTALATDAVHAFLELHIEQGPVLENAETTIGIVTGIVGVNRGEFCFRGRADHAGTTPMTLRRDALRGAASFLERLPTLPAQYGGPATVATCGRLSMTPGAKNVVPATATVNIDFRDQQTQVLDRLEEAMLREAKDCAQRHDLEMTYRRESTTSPVDMDPVLTTAIERSADDLGLRAMQLPSGAGHDAQVMAGLAPTGMVFVPSVAGRSHSWAETTSWEHVAQGANVLLNAILEIADATQEAG